MEHVKKELIEEFDKLEKMISEYDDMGNDIKQEHKGRLRAYQDGIRFAIIVIDKRQEVKYGIKNV